MTRIHLIGIFALYATAEDEKPGNIGAVLTLDQNDETIFRHSLVCGVHYADAHEIPQVNRSNGDGSTLETITSVKVDGKKARVDVLSIDVPQITNAQEMRVLDLGSDSSFVIFDVLFEFENRASCPFHGASKGVSLEELGAIIRVGDRVRFRKALNQLVRSLQSVGDNVDEARGLALTFLSVVTVNLLELGGPRQMHQFLLEAARNLDRLKTTQEVAEKSIRLAEQLAQHLVRQEDSLSHSSIDRALQLVDRNYAKDLSDEFVADQVGLSTSHFRYLFRQATQQPFHKYLMAVRLEKAREMIVDLELGIGEIAKHVGFSSPAHFSRAFSNRFGVSPSQLKSVPN